MKQRIAMLLAAVALPVSLAACGADDPAGQATVRPAQAAMTTEQPADDQTLALGERAVAPFVDYGNRETPTEVAVSVLDVRKGKIADLKDFDLDRKQRNSMPYYIDAKFENLGTFTITRHLLRASSRTPTAANTGPRR